MHDEQADMPSVVSHRPEFIRDAWYYFLEGGSGPNAYIKPFGPFEFEAEALGDQCSVIRAWRSARLRTAYFEAPSFRGVQAESGQLTRVTSDG